jgi:hypothetical protein
LRLPAVIGALALQGAIVVFRQALAELQQSARAFSVAAE